MKKIIFIAAIMHFFVMQTLSQNKNDTLTTHMKPLTVTGTRLGKDISRLAANIIILDSTIYNNSGLKNLTYLLSSLEGIYSYDNSGIGMTGTLNMRGFYGGMSSHHLILIDDIPQNKTSDKLIDFDMIDLDDIEKIEIIKGPASSLYGDNAFSGVINIRTKNASMNQEYKAHASLGSFNTQNYKLSLSGGLLSKLFYGIQAKRTTSDGFREHSDYENNVVKAKLDYLLTEKQIINFVYDYTKNKRGSNPWALTEALIQKNYKQARPGSDKDNSNSNQNRINLGYKNEISDEFYIDGRASYKNRTDESFYTSGSAYTSTKERSEKEKSFAFNLFGVAEQELFGFGNDLSIGIDFENCNYDYLEWGAPNQVRGALSKDYKIKRNKFGPYLQDEIELSQRMNFTLGCRYDLIKTEFVDNKVNANSNDVSIDDFSYRAGATFFYLLNCKIYAVYSYAFRTPTIGQLFTYGSSSNSSLNTETGKNIELGLFHSFSDNIQCGINLFTMKVDNEIWYDYSEKKYKNYGKTIHNGIEAKVEASLDMGLNGFCNYTYNNAKNDGGINDGKFIPNVPPHKVSLGLSYFSSFGLSTNLILTKVEEFYIDDPNTVKLDGFLNAKFGASYKYGLIKVFVDIDNLFNKRYYPYGYMSGTTKYLNPAPEKRVYLAGFEIKI